MKTIASRWMMISACALWTITGVAGEQGHAGHSSTVVAQSDVKPRGKEAKSMAELRAIVKAARASNDPAKMRAALADVETHMEQMSGGMDGCMQHSGGDHGNEKPAPSPSGQKEMNMESHHH